MKKVLGILFILLGFLGGLLPIMPGFLFFFTGLALLSPKLELKMQNVYENYKNHRSIKLAFKELIKALTPKRLKKDKT